MISPVAQRKVPLPRALGVLLTRGMARVIPVLIQPLRKVLPHVVGAEFHASLAAHFPDLFGNVSRNSSIKRSRSRVSAGVYLPFRGVERT